MDMLGICTSPLGSVAAERHVCKCVCKFCIATATHMVDLLLQIKVADSAAVPFVMHRGGVIEGVAVRATPRYGPADDEPRFTNVAIRRVSASLATVTHQGVEVPISLPRPDTACSATRHPHA